MSTRQRVAACALLIASLVTLPRPAAADVYAPGWSTAHATAANSDYSPVKGAKDPAPAGRRTFGGSIYLGATSDDSGRVYVTTNGKGCHLHALDRRTGKTLWCSRRVNRDAIASSALLDKAGRVYLADSRAMHAF